MKWILYVMLFSILCVPALAQFGLTPTQMAYLDWMYANAATNSIPGPWLIDHSVTSNKLDSTLIALIMESETDPVFALSPAFGITTLMISNWNGVVNETTIGAIATNSANNIFTTRYPTNGVTGMAVIHGFLDVEYDFYFNTGICTGINKVGTGWLLP
jgi:hypothetical protein